MSLIEEDPRGTVENFSTGVASERETWSSPASQRREERQRMFSLLDRRAAALEAVRQIKESLWATKYLVLRTIAVDVERGVVTLRGAVHSYHERQVAVAQAAQTPGVEIVIDQLTVQDIGRRRIAR
jgi:osmotically-inducible protein OsmY